MRWLFPNRSISFTHTRNLRPHLVNNQAPVAECPVSANHCVGAQDWRAVQKKQRKRKRTYQRHQNTVVASSRNRQHCAQDLLMRTLAGCLGAGGGSKASIVSGGSDSPFRIRVVLVELTYCWVMPMRSALPRRAFGGASAHSNAFLRFPLMCCEFACSCTEESHEHNHMAVPVRNSKTNMSRTTTHTTAVAVAKVVKLDGTAFSCSASMTRSCAAVDIPLAVAASSIAVVSSGAVSANCTGSQPTGNAVRYDDPRTSAS